MNFRELALNLQKNISNIPGWRTNRKIVVIESDDWGSIRTSSREAYANMKAAGLSVDALHYDAVDSLESNEDMEMLFSVLSEFKDSTSRAPVFTPMCIMGNPDFERIEGSGFQQYFFQPLEETLKLYPNHDRVLDLWKKGKEERLFFPALHGREHINVRRYMKLLQSGDEGIRIAFRNRSAGVGSYKGKVYPNYLGALHAESMEEVKELHSHLVEAGELFKKYSGTHPTCFIAPNAEEPNELARTLKQMGVEFITRSKRRNYPIGDGTFKREFNWIGKRNEFGQRIITRNCFFEPATWGEHEHITDWADNCLKEMDNAFKWKKPAVISAHRVNFIGHIRPENREKGLGELRRLLKGSIAKWPDIEFMTTEELGRLIVSGK